MMEDELRMDIGYWCLTSNVAPSHHRWAWKVYSFFSPNLPKKWVQKWWKVILLVVFIDGNLKQNYPSPNQGPISWQGWYCGGTLRFPWCFLLPRGTLRYRARCRSPRVASLVCWRARYVSRPHGKWSAPWMNRPNYMQLPITAYCNQWFCQCGSSVPSCSFSCKWM